jgi:hypothetical protein
MVVVMLFLLPMIVCPSVVTAIFPNADLRGDKTETLDEPFWFQLSFCAEVLVPPRQFPTTKIVVSRMFASTSAFLQNSTSCDADPVNSAHSCELHHGHITHEGLMLSSCGEVCLLLKSDLFLRRISLDSDC